MVPNYVNGALDGAIQYSDPFATPLSNAPQFSPPPPLSSSVANSGSFVTSRTSQTRRHKHLHTEHAGGEADYKYPFSGNQDIIFYLLRADQETPAHQGRIIFENPVSEGKEGFDLLTSSPPYDPSNKFYTNSNSVQFGPYLPPDIQSTPNETATALATGEYMTNYDFGQNQEFKLPELLRQDSIFTGPKEPQESIKTAKTLSEILNSETIINKSKDVQKISGLISDSLIGSSPFTPDLISKLFSPESSTEFDPTDPIHVITELTTRLLSDRDSQDNTKLLIEALEDEDTVTKPLTLSQRLTKILSGFVLESERSSSQQIAQLLVQLITGYDLTEIPQINQTYQVETESDYLPTQQTEEENSDLSRLPTSLVYWTALLNSLNVKNPHSYAKLLASFTERYIKP